MMRIYVKVTFNTHTVSPLLLLLHEPSVVEVVMIVIIIMIMIITIITTMMKMFAPRLPFLTSTWLYCY